MAGCARRNEPGVYTRVALYVDWINAMVHSDLSTAKLTRSNCPGFVCLWSNRCVSMNNRCNRRIDCLGGEDELNCAYSPVGASKKRIGRQNHQIVSPDANISDHSHEEHVSQSLPTTESPPILPIPDFAHSTESSTPMQKSHSESNTTTTIATTTHPTTDATTPESVITPDALDPNNDPDNAGPTKEPNHRDNLSTTSSSGDSSDVSTNPSTTTSTSTTIAPATITTEKTSTSTSLPTTTIEIPTTTSFTTISEKPNTTPPTIQTTTHSPTPSPRPTTFECQE